MGLTHLIKLVTVFLYLIFAVLYHFSCIDVTFYFLVHCTFLDFQNGGRLPLWILISLQYLSKIQICAYFYVDVQNLVKIGRSAAKLLRIVDFQNGGRPPSCISYDVIADLPRLVFDGANSLLKLHVVVFILCNISQFLYSAHLA